MVSVDLISSGAQKTYLVTVKSQETDSNYSASVRTQHSGRAKTAIITGVMELWGYMESGAGAVRHTATIRHISIIIMLHGVLVVICLSVKTKAIRYLKDTHSAT